jgi:hypothetical protein
MREIRGWNICPGRAEWQRRNQNYKQYEAHCIPPCVNGRRLGWTGFVVGMLKSLRSFALLYMGKLEVPEGIRVPRSMVALRQPRQARNRVSAAPHQGQPDTAFGGVEVVGRWMKPASAEFYGCSKLAPADADMDKIVSLKVYLTDLALYAEFSKVRGEVFPHNPPMGGVTSHCERSGLPRIVGSRHCRVRAARSAARSLRPVLASAPVLKSGHHVGKTLWIGQVRIKPLHRKLAAEMYAAAGFSRGRPKPRSRERPRHASRR